MASRRPRHARHEGAVGAVLEIFTVCTGNICRSPLAAQLLQTRLSDLGVVVPSAGTHGLSSAPMTPEAARLAVSLGVTDEDATAHRSRYLTESMLGSPALILAMTRDHRRAIVQLAPRRMRSTFTIREFARLSSAMSTEQLTASAVGTDAAERVRAMATAVAGQRGLVDAPADPADDDVIDPYGRSWATYQRSAAELEPAVDAVVRAVRAALA